MGQDQRNPELHPLAAVDMLVHAPARLMVLSCLHVVESADYVFLLRLTGLSWGNLSSHLSKLEEAGYIEITREFRGKKPRSTVRMSAKGSSAFTTYLNLMKQVLVDLPD